MLQVCLFYIFIFSRIFIKLSLASNNSNHSNNLRHREFPFKENQLEAEEVLSVSASNSQEENNEDEEDSDDNYFLKMLPAKNNPVKSNSNSNPHPSVNGNINYNPNSFLNKKTHPNNIFYDNDSYRKNVSNNMNSNSMLNNSMYLNM